VAAALVSARPPAEDPRRQPDLRYRTLAAPGLDEDDLFAALQGLPADVSLLGGGPSGPFGPPESAWDEEAERRRRHAELLSKYPPQPDAPGGAGRGAAAPPPG
jgi:hypothetical protein